MIAHRYVLLLLMSVALLSATTTAHAAMTYAGMVMEVSSPKVVYAEGVLKDKRVEPMEYLELQDVIRVPKGESLSLVIFANSMRETISGPALIQVLGSGTVLKDGAKDAISRQRVDYFPTLAMLESRDVQNFGVVGVSTRNVMDGIANYSPVNSMVRPGAPVQFSWQAVPGATGYRLTVMGAGGKTLKTVTTKEPMATVQGLPLQPGSEASWKVAAMKGGSTMASSQATTFNALDAEKVGALSLTENKIRNRFDPSGLEHHVTLALLYRTYMLQSDEAASLKQALERNPNSDAIAMRLRNLDPNLVKQ